MAGEATLETSMLELRRDKRGGSRVGRRKRKDRIPCLWLQQYLDPESAIYTSKEFRDTFGVPKEVFRCAFGVRLQYPVISRTEKLYLLILFLQISQ